jgi:hypothetical protein
MKISLSSLPLRDPRPPKVFISGALPPPHAIEFLENQNLEWATFCEQKGFPLKLPLQKNFNHLKLKFWGYLRK